jgi:hypothetical protein
MVRIRCLVYILYLVYDCYKLDNNKFENNQIYLILRYTNSNSKLLKNILSIILY